MADIPPPPATPLADFEYVLSGVRAKRRATLRIIASSAREAREEMSRRGYEDVQLLTDDIGRLRLSEKKNEPRPYSAKTQANLGNLSIFQARLLVAKVIYRAWAVPIIIVSIPPVMRLVNGRPLGWTAAVAAAFIVGPFLFAMLRPSAVGVMHQVEEARVNADWHKVLRLLPRLEKSFKRLGPATAAGMTGEHRARALAGLGRTQEAFAEIEKLRARGDIPEHLLQLKTVCIYSQLQDYDAMEQCYERSIELNPDNWVGWAMLAEHQAMTLRHPENARRSLSMLNPDEMTQDSQLVITATIAGIALCEARYAEVRDAFEQVLRVIEPKVPANPMWKALLAKYRSMLAIAYAKTGKLHEAQALYKQAEPILTAHKLEIWLKPSREAVGRMT